MVATHDVLDLLDSSDDEEENHTPIFSSKPKVLSQNPSVATQGGVTRRPSARPVVSGPRIPTKLGHCTVNMSPTATAGIIERRKPVELRVESPSVIYVHDKAAATSFSLLGTLQESHAEKITVLLKRMKNSTRLEASRVDVNRVFIEIFRIADHHLDRGELKSWIRTMKTVLGEHIFEPVALPSPPSSHIGVVRRHSLSGIKDAVSSRKDIFGDEHEVFDLAVGKSEDIQKDDLDAIYHKQQKNALELLPQYEIPAALAHLDLFDYQKQGIRWLVHQETTNDFPGYFEETHIDRFKRYKCRITGRLLIQRPEPIRGAILADEMGLGKTVQTLGAILGNPPKGQTGYPYRPMNDPQKKEPRCTLIVSPLSVMSSWHLEIKKHINHGGRKNIVTVQFFHGNQKKKVLDLIAENKVDIVLTTYHTVAYELGKCAQEDHTEASPTKKQKVRNLFQIDFHRIVLDEAHAIRNVKTCFFKAITTLSSNYKLVLTGTPFINRPNDLHAMFAFLGVMPLGNKQVFHKFVSEPVANHLQVGLARVYTTLSYVQLRREKMNVNNVLNLPPKIVHEVAVPFRDCVHKKIHDVLYETARGIFIFMLNTLDPGDISGANFMMLVEAVLRIRQSCCHGSLVPPERRSRAEEAFSRIAKAKDSHLNATEAGDLLDALATILPDVKDDDNEGYECAICLEQVDEQNAAVLKTCKHLLCQECIQRVQNQACPLCFKKFNHDDIVSHSDAEKAAKAPTDMEKRQQVVKEADKLGRSPKLEHMFRLIGEMESDEKAVIFSQWTSHLDIIERELRAEGYTYCRIDGSMSPKGRIQAMEIFETEGTHSMQTPRFMLCSLMATGVGVTLTRANVAFMCDPWWNEAIENQAMDRIYRIGQKRPVRVYRLLMKDTVEARFVRLQVQKATLGRGSMTRLSCEELRKARLTMMKDLFEIDDHDVVWT